ncbi:MAG: FAD-dependent oxidoreductase [Myxococcota bacterium]
MKSRTFSPAGRATLGAMIDAVAPRCAYLPMSGADLEVTEALDTLVGGFEPASRRMIRALVLALRLAPLASGSPRTFHRLSPEGREEFLRRTLASPGVVHDVVTNVRALCEMVFTGHPRFREHLGDRGEPFRPGLPVPEEVPIPTIRHPELARTTTIECDVVIVGSGAGGATVARILAEAGLDVVIVEEGGPPARGDFQGPVLSRLNKYCRQNGLTTTLGTPPIPVPMGRVVGGTTVVNSGTCLRAPDSLLHEWATVHGIEMAAPDSLGPHYDALAEQLSIQPVTDDIMGHNGQVVRRGAEELKLRAHAIPRPTRGCAGTGQCAFGCPRDAKQAMHLTHLPAAVAAGARIYAGCTVERVLMRGSHANGVEARIADATGRPTGHKLTVRAKTVFLAAGALSTPVLLMRAGLGGSGRAVGRHLRIHPGSGVTGRFDETINGWQGVMQSFAIDEYLDDGLLLEATFPPLGMTYSAGALPGIGEDHAELLAQYGHMASIGSIVSDTSQGRIRRVPGLGPSMQYSLNQTDTDRLVRAIAISARVLLAAGAREVYPGLPGAETLRKADDIDAFERNSWSPRHLKVGAYHPMGTARMGADAERSVCDPSGGVHGTENLYVADTSLFPGSTHVNPQYTLMALCRSLAERFLDSLAAGGSSTAL